MAEHHHHVRPPDEVRLERLELHLMEPTPRGHDCQDLPLPSSYPSGVELLAALDEIHERHHRGWNLPGG